MAKSVAVNQGDRFGDLFVVRETKTRMAAQGKIVYFECICSFGHLCEKPKPSLLNGKTLCPTCYQDKRRLTKDVVDKRLKEAGICLAEPYKGANGLPHKFKCFNGHSFCRTPRDIMRAKACPLCSHPLKHTDDSIERILQTRKASLLEPYKGSMRLAHKLQCSKGHEWSALLTTIYRSGCPHCAGNAPRTKEEKEARKIINSVQKRIHQFLQKRGQSKLPFSGSLFKVSEVIPPESIEIYQQAKKMGLTVDHIIPVSIVGYDSIEKVAALNDPRNLRIISRQENASRSNKITLDEMNKLFGDYHFDLLKKYKSSWELRYPHLNEWLEIAATKITFPV